MPQHATPTCIFKLKCFIFIVKHIYSKTQLLEQFITKETSLRPYLAPYVEFSRCTLFTKAMPTNMNSSSLQLPYKRKGKPKTCLTNHKGSISHPIIPLVINSLEGGDTHTHTGKSNFKKPVMYQPSAGVCLV